MHPEGRTGFSLWLSGAPGRATPAGLPLSETTGVDDSQRSPFQRGPPSDIRHTCPGWHPALAGCGGREEQQILAAQIRYLRQFIQTYTSCSRGQLRSASDALVGRLLT